MTPRQTTTADAAAICAWLHASREADRMWAAAKDADTPEAARELFGLFAAAKKTAAALARRLP